MTENEDNMKKAIVLLSGGMDSATIFAIAKNQGYQVYALSLSYGQKHKIELRRARSLAKKMGAESHKVLHLDLNQLGGSALTDSDIEVPHHKNTRHIGKGIPVTYVPARNTIFLSLALGYAETIDAYHLFIGVNAMDYSGYPDCRPEYIRAFEKLANLATVSGVEGKGKFKIETPLIDMTKADIIKKGTKLGVDFSLTTSCYDPIDDNACGECDACLLRLKGFKEAGLEDPVVYV